MFDCLSHKASCSVQSWEDEDVPAMLEDLGEALAANIKLLSSWDKYKKEVLSGSLDWTPMHTSDVFWTENAPHFEERDFQVRCGTHAGHGALKVSSLSGMLLAEGWSTRIKTTRGQLLFDSGRSSSPGQLSHLAIMQHSTCMSLL